jgi:hypothetical protein
VTPTITKTFTLTPVDTAVDTAIATATPTAPQGTATITPTSTKEPRFLEISNPILYPCPYNPKFGADLKIKVTLNKGCGSLKLKIYTTAYRRIFEKEFSGNFSGDTILTAGADNFRNLSNGVYYYIITGTNPAGEAASTPIKVMIVIKLGG